jgi:hypothetical protein
VYTVAYQPRTVLYVTGQELKRVTAQKLSNRRALYRRQILEPAFGNRDFVSPHMPGADSQNLTRLHSHQLFRDHFSPDHCPRLPPHPPLDIVHRAAVANRGDILCL